MQLFPRYLQFPKIGHSYVIYTKNQKEMIVGSVAQPLHDSIWLISCAFFLQASLDRLGLHRKFDRWIYHSILTTASADIANVLHLHSLGDGNHFANFSLPDWL